MNHISDELFSLHARYPGLMTVAMALIKGAALLCLTWGLARLLRQRSAVARAWVWRSGFAALLLLAAWPYRPALLGGVRLEVLVPTEEVVVSYSSLRKQPVDVQVEARASEPLVIEKDTTFGGVMKRAVRELDPFVVHAWWIVFMVLLGVKLVRARIGLRGLMAQSNPAHEDVIAACERVSRAAGLRSMPAVRVSADVDSPLLTGGRRRIIWLPDESAEWSAKKLNAVLHHEVAHLTRNDGAWQWAATIAACFWWWNPVVWFALARLKAETELAADEMVLVREVSATDFAQALVEIASVLLPRPARAFGVPMLGVSAIEQRVRAMLRHNPWRGKVGALGSTSLALLAVLMSGIVLVSCKQQPPKYISLAKLVVGGRMVGNSSPSGPAYVDYLQDFYGTIIETIESSEMRRRALDRVRALHPDMKESDVEIQVSQNKGSAIFNVRAFGSEPKYTRVFLDALLDEFLAFRIQIREQQKNKALTTLAEDVVRREKNLQETQDKLTAYLKQNNIVLITGVNNSAAMHLARLTDSREDMVTQLTVLDLARGDFAGALEEKESRAADLAASAGETAFPRLTMTEKDYLQNKLELLKLGGEKAFLVREAGESDPKVAEINRSIGKLEAVLEFEEKQLAEEMKRTKASLERRLKALDAQIEVKKAEALDLGGKIATHGALEKDYKERKQAYDEILALVRRFTVNEDMSGDTVTVMERASGAVQDMQRGWFGL